MAVSPVSVHSTTLTRAVFKTALLTPFLTPPFLTEAGRARHSGAISSRPVMHNLGKFLSLMCVIGGGRDAQSLVGISVFVLELLKYM